MVFDFSVTSGTIYVDGSLPTYDLYRLRLVSMYNNKGIENTIGDIELTRLTGTTRYTVFTYDFTGGPIADVIDQDGNGYYMAYFEGAPPSRVYVELAKYPAKVKTQFTESYPEQYVSPNEDNEQYVYYRS